MYKIYVGEISSDRQTDWFRKDENPYAVWSGKPIATEVCTIETLTVADQLLCDGVDIDWGSRAWRGSKKQIMVFFKTHDWDRTPLQKLKNTGDYVVVFIESVWGDSA